MSGGRVAGVRRGAVAVCRVALCKSCLRYVRARESPVRHRAARDLLVSTTGTTGELGHARAAPGRTPGLILTSPRHTRRTHVDSHTRRSKDTAKKDSDSPTHATGQQKCRAPRTGRRRESVQPRPVASPSPHQEPARPLPSHARASPEPQITIAAPFRDSCRHRPSERARRRRSAAGGCQGRSSCFLRGGCPRTRKRYPGPEAAAARAPTWSA